MTSCILVECDHPLLDIRTIQNQDMLKAVMGGAELHWCCSGQIRRVPRSVLTQTYRQYQDGLKLVDADRLSEVMAAAHTIRWDQAEAIGDGDGKPMADQVHPGANRRGKRNLR